MLYAVRAASGEERICYREARGPGIGDGEHEPCFQGETYIAWRRCDDGGVLKRDIELPAEMRKPICLIGARGIVLGGTAQHIDRCGRMQARDELLDGFAGTSGCNGKRKAVRCECA